ncbi:hypothetical protein G9F31_12555 [Acinetobacter sp. 187]|uniref:Uncharacterized protein n=1 Tax=Acinetobacter lanii TaxID=2715163 RepID=A0A6G8S240_9GAMM|nr:hypothetical protein [Acinetobacter lanii]NHC04584.1 hypothetical protein [Acinetobacter lanii]QIO08184.1 hypothetical protein G8D99_03505 [Acinetobacter lanii]
MSQSELSEATLWWGINIRTGVVNFDNLSWLNSDYKLNKNSFLDFSEDLLQIKFLEKNIVLDVGWYKYNGKGNGYFKVCLIKDQNWEKVLTYRHCRKACTLKKEIKELINRVDSY